MNLHLKLIQPIDLELIDWNSRYPSTLSLPLSMSGTFRQTGSLVARTLPPELFEYICNAADGGSSSSRLVCQYWNRQCTPHVFRQIDVEESPERIRALWRHRAGPTFVRHMEIIKGVPYYERNSKFPWIHLLSQTSTSTESVWKSKWGSASRISIWGPDWPKVTSRISISGPFSGGHRTMRSVHFALPRFLPRALSCGIKNLYLNSEIHFRQFQDLLHLACELPDLEVLECKARFGSLPTEVWRRRPRTNRNKLRKCKFLGLQQTNETAESIYAPGMLHIALYMSVYDVDSFFVEMEVLPILALLEAIRPPGWPLTTCYSHDPQNHSQTLSELQYYSYYSRLNLMLVYPLCRLRGRYRHCTISCAAYLT